ncbi:hypothetical protein ACMFMG_008406 [Clarireedia jacksonii]
MFITPLERVSNKTATNRDWQMLCCAVLCCAVCKNTSIQVCRSTVPMCNCIKSYEHLDMHTDVQQVQYSAVLRTSARVSEQKSPAKQRRGKIKRIQIKATSLSAAAQTGSEQVS